MCVVFVVGLLFVLENSFAVLILCFCYPCVIRIILCMFRWAVCSWDMCVLHPCSRSCRRESSRKTTHWKNQKVNCLTVSYTFGTDTVDGLLGRSRLVPLRWARILQPLEKLCCNKYWTVSNSLCDGGIFFIFLVCIQFLDDFADFFGRWSFNKRNEFWPLCATFFEGNCSRLCLIHYFLRVGIVLSSRRTKKRHYFWKKFEKCGRSKLHSYRLSLFFVCLMSWKRETSKA